jgi:hypothetical protein
MCVYSEYIFYVYIILRVPEKVFEQGDLLSLFLHLMACLIGIVILDQY